MVETAPDQGQSSASLTTSRSKNIQQLLENDDPGPRGYWLTALAKDEHASALDLAPWRVDAAAGTSLYPRTRNEAGTPEPLVGLEKGACFRGDQG